MDYEGLIDDNRVLIACSMNYETVVTFTYGHFNKVVFAVYCLIMSILSHLELTSPSNSLLLPPNGLQRDFHNVACAVYIILFLNLNVKLDNGRCTPFFTIPKICFSSSSSEDTSHWRSKVS